MGGYAGDGPTLVGMNGAEVLFLHPIGLDHHTADWLHLPSFIAPDLPGHGVRAVPRAGMTLDDVADEIAGWIRHPMDVVGALIGGTAALHLALRHPRLVRSLLIADTSAKTEREHLLARADAVAAGDLMVEENLIRWFGADQVNDPQPPESVRYARRSLSAMAPESMAAMWRALAWHDVMDELHRLTMPITIVAGTRDVVHPPDKQAALAASLPLAQLIEIDAQHMSPLDEPDLFSAAIASHLEWARELLEREDARRSA